MPYLLQNSQNRVENIKKKFENSYFDDEKNVNGPFNNSKSLIPSKTGAEQVLKSVNLENECDYRVKHLGREKFSGKAEVNKSDNKAVVRRSPAFRREKLNYTKCTTSLSNKDNASDKGKRLEKGKDEKFESSTGASRCTIERNKEHFPAASSEPKIFQCNLNVKCGNNELSSRIISNSDLTERERNEIKKNTVEKITIHPLENNENTGEKSNGNESKTELKLSESLRLALRAPLPKGPPPKKPPRTFLHTAHSRARSNDSSSVMALRKEDPMLRLKLEKIEKVVNSLDSNTHRNESCETINNNLNEVGKKVNNSIVVAPCSMLQSFAQTKSGERFCLKSVNCINSPGYEKPVCYERENGKQSSFYVDAPKDGKDCFKTDKKILHNLTGKVLSCDGRSEKLEPIYDVPYVEKKKSFESFGKCVTTQSGSGARPPNQLHYMCTDLVNCLHPNSTKFPLGQGDAIPVGNSHSNASKEIDGKKPYVHETGTRDKTCRESGLVSRRKDGGRAVNAEVKALVDDAFKWKKKAAGFGRSGIGDGVGSDSESTSSGADEHQLSVTLDSGEISRKEDRRCEERDNSSTRTTSTLRKTCMKRVSSIVLGRAISPKVHDKHSYMHLFESCILVGLTLGESKTTVPYVKNIFPSNVKPPHLIECLCFPDAATWSQSSCSLQQGEQYYSLVITNENGERKFGYCRRVLPEGGNFCLPLVYCIISRHRANGFYYKVLEELESRHGSNELQQFVKELYECPFPGPGQSLKLRKILEEVARVSPVKSDESTSSTIVRRPCDVRREERDLSQLVDNLKVSVLLKVFSSLLLERKVLLLGNSLRTLSSCIEALQSLLIPFSWQHTFIPVLPSHLTELCDAPTPYIIGLVKSTLTSDFLSNFNLEEGIMVDLEESVIVKCCGDEGGILPQRLTKGLKTALNLAMSSSIGSENERNVLISEAFIRFFVEICGNYAYFMVKQPDGRKNFQKEEFVGSVPVIQPFLDWFVETAMFHTFIQDRLENDVEDLFKRRCVEHLEETEKQISAPLSRNCKGMNKKVKSLGDRIKDLTLFSK